MCHNITYLAIGPPSYVCADAVRTYSLYHAPAIPIRATDSSTVRVYFSEFSQPPPTRVDIFFLCGSNLEDLNIQSQFGTIKKCTFVLFYFFVLFCPFFFSILASTLLPPPRIFTSPATTHGSLTAAPHHIIYLISSASSHHHPTQRDDRRSRTTVDT